MKGDIVDISNADELLKLIREEKDERVKLRLIFLNAMANFGLTYEDASALVGISESTGYLWIRKWNANGHQSLQDKYNKSGRPPRLSEENMKQLEQELRSKDYWVTKDVVVLIKERFGVDLSEDQVIKIMRDKFNMKFSKPYPFDYRQQDNAEELLDLQFNLVLSLLKAKGIKEEEIAIGFIDETRPQNTANTVRVWSFEKPIIKKNTTKFYANTIGFYAIMGESVSGFLEDSKGVSIAGFLEDIKKANIEYKAIVVIIDNFSSHKSKVVRDKAEELGIYLVYLPPYSPNLNPIEFIWKSIKRVLSLHFVSNLDELKRIITENWSICSNSLSYAKYWIKRFLLANMNYKTLCVRL